MGDFDSGQIDGAARRRPPRRLSQVFTRLAQKSEGHVSFADIRDALGDRSFAALLVLFAAFNMIPLPPPSSAILGLPLVIVSAQMVYGSKRVWLPGFLVNRTVSAAQFRTVMDWVIPRLVRLENFVRPRYWPFWRRNGDRVIGVIALLLAVVVTLPIPLGNWLPAFSTALLGLSLIERDGILFAIGSAVGLAAISVIVFLGAAASMATQAAVGWFM